MISHDMIDLRPGVWFSDGSAFTAEDVVFTYGRAPNVPRSPAGFGPALRAIASVETTGPLTIEREALLDRATDIVAAEEAWFPVLRPLNIEAMRAGLDHTPRGDGEVTAASIHPAKE